MLELTVRRGEVSSELVLRREIDERQLSIVKLALNSDMTYGEALGVFGSWFDAPEPRVEQVFRTRALADAHASEEMARYQEDSR